MEAWRSKDATSFTQYSCGIGLLRRPWRVGRANVPGYPGVLFNEPHIRDVQSLDERLENAEATFGEGEIRTLETLMSGALRPHIRDVESLDERLENAEATFGEGEIRTLETLMSGALRPQHPRR